MKNTKKSFISAIMAGACAFQVAAFNTQDFESVAGGSTSFPNDTQTFLVSSTGGDTYNVFEPGFMDGISTDTCNPNPPATCGWGGSAVDQRFLDNSATGNGNTAATGDGSDFTLVTDDGSNFFVEELYLFCATASITAHSGSATITGRRNGMDIFTISLDSTACNGPNSFGVNNGFTHVDLATIGMSDYTDDPIDTLTFTSTADLDYMALDAFRSEFTALPVELQHFQID